MWLKFSLFVVKITVLLTIAWWLAEDPGVAVMVWKGWEIETSLAVVCVVLFVSFVLLTLLDRSWRDIRGVPDAVQFWLERRRERKGYEAATLGLIAAAAGDSAASSKHAERSGKLLGASPLTLMLKAQTAQLLEQADEAEACYQKMAESEDTQILGLRGLIETARKKNDSETALRFAEHVIDLHPKARWAHETVFSLHLAQADYAQAEAALRRAQRNRANFTSNFSEKIAALLMAQAQTIQRNSGQKNLSDLSEADQGRIASLILRANGEDPAFVPAAVAAIRHHTKAGAGRKANKVGEQAWQKSQHPGIAAAFCDIDPSEHPLPRLGRIKQLCGQTKGVETDVVLARYAVEARDFNLAEQALDRAVEVRKTASLYNLRARLEEARGSEPSVAMMWRERARASQELDPTWVCGSCNASFVDWSAICPNCSDFGQLCWTPPRRYEKDRLALPAPLAESQVLPSSPSVVEPVDHAIRPPSPDAPSPDAPSPDAPSPDAPSPSKTETPN